MNTRSARAFLTAAFFGLSVTSVASAEITLLGVTSIPFDALDKSGLDNLIGDKIPHNRLGSFGSAIDYTGKDNLYIAADDRGPGDGSTAFRPRWQTFRILIDAAKAGSSDAVKVELVSTTLMTREDGQPLWGFTGGFNAREPRLGSRFDAEGVRVLGSRIFISDEYGPWVDEFNMQGQRVQRFAIPDRFVNDHPSGEPDEELPPKASKGRLPNRGFEGLALSPDGRMLYAMLQSPLIQDGVLGSAGGEAKAQRVGTNVRILGIDVATGATREYVYVMESAAHGINEILAVDNQHFIVLERDGKAGAKAKNRGLYLIDIAGATDVSRIDALPSTTLPAGVQPVRKKLLLDFMNPAFKLTGEQMPEKIEGLTFGPNLPDGRRTLIVTSDNDFREPQPSWFWVFALDAKDLAMPAAKP